MKLSSLFFALTLAANTPLIFADHNHSQAGQAGVATAPDAAWLAKAKAEYPLKTCVVSEEEIGGPMGEGFDYVYQQDGKPGGRSRFRTRRAVVSKTGVSPFATLKPLTHSIS